MTLCPDFDENVINGRALILRATLKHHQRWPAISCFEYSMKMHLELFTIDHLVGELRFMV
jgi:hypothetical protein